MKNTTPTFAEHVDHYKKSEQPKSEQLTEVEDESLIPDMQKLCRLIERLCGEKNRLVREKSELIFDLAEMTRQRDALKENDNAKLRDALKRAIKYDMEPGAVEIINAALKEKT